MKIRILVEYRSMVPGLEGPKRLVHASCSILFVCSEQAASHRRLPEPEDAFEL